jgi:predicted PurR-regulated permease PerM
LIFWWLGLPAPVLWGMVMALLATVPNMGAFIVWAPTAAGLALQGDTQSAIILAVWGLTAISLIDNLLYPVMVGSRLRMHSALVFFSVLGGLFVFGVAGLILGPVTFALAQALIEIWRRRTAHGQAAECAVTSTPAIVMSSEAPPATPKQLVTS